MDDKKMNTDNLIFGLVIGTRSIVGICRIYGTWKFQCMAHYVKEHETRAMLDGQIHDIQKVGETTVMSGMNWKSSWMAENLHRPVSLLLAVC